jgi:signal transduction histidine kinase
MSLLLIRRLSNKLYTTMKMSLENKITYGFILSLLILLIISIVSYQNIIRLSNDRRKTKQSQEVLTLLSTLISTITDAETAQRGYIITGNERFLERVDQADLKIIGLFQGLRQLTSDNPSQQERIKTIKLLIDSRLRMIKFFATMRRNEGFDRVKNEIEKGKGRLLQNEIRRNVEIMQIEEHIIQVKLEQESNYNTRFTKLVLIFGSLTAFLFFVLALVIIRRGLVERKLAESEIKRKNGELQRLSSEKDKFFSIIAHDLRSPFYGFLGLSQRLVEELPVMSMNEAKRIAGNLNDSAVATFRLLENLLEWSRMEQGLIPFQQDLVQLLPVIDECLSATWESAKNKAIEIKCDVKNDLSVYGDRNMIQTIIRNLVSNAIKFTKKDGNIYITAKPVFGNSIEISIKDSGVGMNNEIIENLFKLHVNTSRPGTNGEPSTGLGLVLCKEFVEKNNGTIWAESEEGKGSTFYFTLPQTS